MNNELYRSKYQYERLIKSLNDNYNRLNTVYYNAIACRKRIKENVEIDGTYFDAARLDKIIKRLEENRNLIINNLLPQARYQYNIIVNKISKL